MALVSIHLAILVATVCVILIADHQGVQYFRGKRATISLRFITWTHRLIWLGLLGMIVTGIFLVAPAWDYFSTQPEYWLKMFFVVVLVINAIAIGQLSRHATSTPYQSLPSRVQKKLLLSGAVSSLSWIGAIVIGLFFL